MSKTTDERKPAFHVAPRRAKPAEVQTQIPQTTQEERNSPGLDDERQADLQATETSTPQQPAPATNLLAKSPEERQQEQQDRALDRESALNRIRALKKKNARDSKHYINVPLDFDTKKALETASHDHGIKMAEIVRDAMKVYLKSAGYLK